MLDWQDLVNYTKGLLLKEALKFVMGEISKSKFGWFLNNPVTRWIVTWMVKRVIEAFDTTLFKLNMELLKTDQFKDYREAVADIIAAPEDITDDQWEKLEHAANDRFRRANRLIA